MESVVSGVDNQEIGIVVMDRLAPGASTKEGIQAISDSGHHLFGHSHLNSSNGAVSSYGGRSIPRWVRVTWRRGVTDFLGDRYGRYTTGTVVGDYTVLIQERIPQEVIKYVTAAPRRALVLRFRVKDDAVLLAWDVQQDTPTGYGWDYVMHGGDFKDPKLFNGKVVEAGWERPQFNSHGSSGNGSTHVDHGARLK